MVASIKCQSRPPDQVIFVEDHSADCTAQILQELIEEWKPRTPSQLKLVRNEQNLGQAASLNRGIEEAEADLIMIVNDDDYLLHDCVEVAFGLFRRYPEVALIGGHSLHFSGDKALSRLPKLIREFLPPEQLELDLRQTKRVSEYRRYNDLNMTHTGSCFLKSAWKTAGGYQIDKKRRLVPFSDRDFQLRVNALFPIAVSPDVPLSCWRNDSSVDTGLNS
jgi:GT2 family glycosyltransferase